MLRAVMDAIRANLGLKAIATLAAVGLWFYVMNTENPIRREVRSTPVSVVGAPSDLAVARVQPESLQVALSGRLSGLSRDQVGGLSVVGDLAGSHEGRNEVPVRVVGLPPRVALAGLERETVQVWLERRSSRTMTVSVVCTGEPAEGYAITGPPVARPTSVAASGPDGLVARMARVVARLDVTGLRSRQAVSVALEARDSNGEALAGVALSPGRVEVTVTLAADESRQVPVRLRLGTVAAGRSVTGTRVTPSMVNLRGPERALSAVTEVPTERLTISHDSGVREYHVPLALPEGTWLPEGEETVTVRVTVRAARPAPGATQPPGQQTTGEGTSAPGQEPDQAGKEGAVEQPRSSNGEPDRARSGHSRPSGTPPTQPGTAEGETRHPTLSPEEVTERDGRP